MLFISKIIFIFLFSYISPLLFVLREGQERCIIDEFIEKSYRLLCACEIAGNDYISLLIHNVVLLKIYYFTINKPCNFRQS